MTKKKKTKDSGVNDTYVTNNMEVHTKENFVLVSINPRIYSLDVVYSAAYVLTEKAYVIIDGNPNEEIIVEIRPKESGDVETLGRELNNELLNYAVYKQRAVENKDVRSAIVQRALATPNASEESQGADSKSDPEDIAVPWDEKEES